MEPYENLSIDIPNEYQGTVIEEAVKVSKVGIESKKERISMPSDQVSMVMKLFDGKYID